MPEGQAERNGKIQTIELKVEEEDQLATLQIASIEHIGGGSFLDS